MLPSYIKTAKDRCALIEGAGFGDTSFYGRWLLAAAAAETHWKTIRNEEEFFGLTWGAIPDLGVGALHMLAGIRSNYCVVSVRPEEMVDWPIMLEFVLLIELGLLTLTDNHYLMTMPTQEPNIERVREAAMKLAKTGDDNCTAYPERFIIAMTRFEAERWRRQNGDVVTHGLRIPYSRTYH